MEFPRSYYNEFPYDEFYKKHIGILWGIIEKQYNLDEIAAMKKAKELLNTNAIVVIDQTTSGSYPTLLMADIKDDSRIVEGNNTH